MTSSVDTKLDHFIVAVGGVIFEQVARVEVQSAPIGGEIEVDRQTCRHIGAVALTGGHCAQRVV